MIDDLESASGRHVSRGTYRLLEKYTALLRDENDRQNLVARSTLACLWERHIIDSAQLLPLAAPDARWVDVGAGAGIPGMVLAIISRQPICLIEPRRLRADFLFRCTQTLNLENVVVQCAKVERVNGQFDAITARAVASVPKLFAMTLHLSHPATRWILPKGRTGAKELAEAAHSWQGRFRTEPSITDGDAVIVVAEGVRPRGGTSR